MTDQPTIAIVVGVESKPHLSIRVGEHEWPTLLDWLTQPQTRAAILQLVELLAPER